MTTSTTADSSAQRLHYCTRAMSDRPFVLRLVRWTGQEPRLGWLQAFAVLTLACVIFLWEPLTTGGWYVAGDVSGLGPIVRAEGASAGRLPQIDVIVDLLPWYQFSGDELASGRFPAWNPYNNSGVPHFANIQTAVFSPFTIPFHVLGMRPALIVSVYLLLMTAGLFAFGLMRHLGTSKPAGIVTALVYMFTGYMMFWLHWPLASVAALLPGMLWAASAVVRAPDWRRSVRRGVALMVLVALGVLAGHPETFFFGVLAVAVWSVVAILARTREPRAVLARIGVLAGAGLGGLALAAVQLVPFLEYLFQSPTFAGRQVHVFQSVRWSWIHVFPLAQGSPTMAYAGPYGFHHEFHEITVLYVGVIALVLAAVAAVSTLWTRRRAPLAFAGMAAAIMVFLYDVAGLGTWVSGLPVMSLMMPSRLAVVWGFCVAVLAGFGVDALRSRGDAHEGLRRRLVIGLVALAGLGVAVQAYRAWHFHEFAAFDSNPQRALARRTLTDHLGFVGVSFVIGAVCVVGLALIQHRRAQRFALAGVVLVVFTQGAFLLRGQNPTVPEDRFMNFDPRLARIAGQLGHNQTLWFDQARLMPDVNLWIPTYSPDNYDVIGIETYERLYRAMLDPPQSIEIAGVELGLLTGPYDPADVRALQTMGIRRVVSSRGYPAVSESNLGAPGADVGDDGTGRHSFRWHFEPPRALLVYTEGIDDGGVVEATISGEDLPGEIRRRIEIHGGVGVASLPEDLPEAGVLHADLEFAEMAGSDHRIDLASIVASPLGDLELEASVDGFQIFRVPGPSGFVVAPPTTRYVDHNDSAFDEILAPDFDPIGEVVVEDASRAGTVRAGSDPGRVRIEKMTPTRVRATVTRDEAGTALFTQNHFPGWRATVNGQEATVHRANSTFMAVDVPAGTSTVEFRFESSSIAIGFVVSTVAALLALAALVATRVGRGDRR